MTNNECANWGTLLLRAIQCQAGTIIMWKDIEGFEGYYQVSDEGKVRSLDRYVAYSRGKNAGRTRLLRGKEMKLTESKSNERGNQGYLVVNLRKNCNSSVIPVHSLVAKAFVQNEHGLPTINHIDGNKHNNHVSNLEWASYADNNIHALTNGLRNPRGVMINQYSIDGIFIRSFRSVTEASKVLGLSRCSISHCVNGRQLTYAGYIWKKVPEGQTTISSESTSGDELPMEAQRPQ